MMNCFAACVSSQRSCLSARRRLSAAICRSMIHQLCGLFQIVVLLCGFNLAVDLLNLFTQLLHAAKYGCINLHVSLLPKYRGSAPIQWSVLNGNAGTGVTIMQLDEGLDTGDILMVEPVAIDPEETSGELFDRVSAVGAKTLVTALEKIKAGELTPQKQDDAQATMAPPLTKDMARFDFTQDAAHIHNWVRGMNPWPVAWFEQDGKRIKVLESRLAENPQHAAPGTVLALKPLTIAAENGAVALLTVTPEGGKPMAGTPCAAGRRLKAGHSLRRRALSPSRP